MIYYDNSHDCLVGKCDACGFKRFGFRGETDRLEFTCGVFKDEGWLQKKENGKWKHYCPECKEEYYRQKRVAYFRQEAEANGKA